MEEVYNKIWELAKPYYLKGRPMDIDHIEWMMEDALSICEKEELDESLLLPLVILHDVGYGVTNPVYFDKDFKKIHMVEGSKIARKILEKVSYPSEKIAKIEYYISVHDNWIFGDNEIYKKEMILGVFTDLDYIWMATSKGFDAIKKILKKTDKKMIEYLEKNEKPINRPFSVKTTKELYDKYLEDRKREVYED